MNHSSTLPGDPPHSFWQQGLRNAVRRARAMSAMDALVRIFIRPTLGHMQVVAAAPPAFQARRSPAALLLIVLAHLGLLAVLASSHTIRLPRPATPLWVNVLQVAPSIKSAPEVPDVATRAATKPAIVPPLRTMSAMPRPSVPANASPLSALALPELARPEPANPATVTPAATLSAMPVAPAPVPTVAAQPPTAPRFDADYFDNPAPTYPPLSRRNREAGRVVLHVFVEASGLPGKVEVYTRSGFERLDNAAIAAVLRWRFLPARQGKNAVAAWVLVPIDFSLQG